MVMWTKQTVYLVLKIILLNIFVCYGEPGEIHVKIRKEGLALNGSFYRKNTKTLVECVYCCLQNPNCKSFGYNKTSTVCHLYPSDAVNSQSRNGTLLFGDLRETFTGGLKEIPELTTESSAQHKRTVLLRRGKDMSWREADHVCNAVKKLSGYKARIHRIYNASEQAAAVNMLTGSGVEYAAIAALKTDFKWVTRGRDELLYSDWADGHPRFMKFFVVLSKQTGYKWESIAHSHFIDGVLCETI